MSQGTQMRTLVILLFIFMSAGLPAQGKSLVTLTANIASSEDISDAVFSADGKLLATSGSFGIKLWDTVTGRLLRTFRHNALAMAISFVPNSGLIASAHKDGKIKIWNLATGADIATFQLDPAPGSYPDWARTLWIDDDGKFLVVGTQSGAVGIWSFPERKLLHQIKHDAASTMNRYVVAARLSSKRNKLISVGHNFVQIFDLVAGKIIGSFKLPKSLYFNEASIVSDNEFIVRMRSSYCRQDEVIHFDLAEQKTISIDKPSLCDNSSDGWMRGQPRVFSLGAERLALIRNGSSEIKVWDLRNHRIIKTVRWSTGSNVSVLAMDPTFKLALVLQHGRAGIRHVRTGALIIELTGRILAATSAASSLDGRYVLLSHSNETVRRKRDEITLWQVDRLKPRSLRLAGPAGTTIYDFALDARKAIGSNKKGEIVLVSIDNGHELKRFGVPVIARVWNIVLSPDGKTAIVIGETSGDDKNSYTVATLLNVEAGKVLLTFKPDPKDGSANSAAFSLDGRMFALGRRQGLVELWSTSPLRQINRLSTSKDKSKNTDASDVWSLRFSSDSKRLIGSSIFYADAFMWNISTGVLAQTFEMDDIRSHYPFISTMALSHDGKLAVGGLAQRHLSSGDDDAQRGDIIAWDVSTGIIRFSIRGHEGSVRAITFSPNDKWIVSAGYDGTIRYWDRKDGRWMATFMVTKDNGWLMITESGFFAGPRHSQKFLNVVRGVKALPGSKVRTVLERPNLVNDFLRGDIRYARAARALKLDSILTKANIVTRRRLSPLSEPYQPRRRAFQSRSNRITRSAQRPGDYFPIRWGLVSTWWTLQNRGSLKNHEIGQQYGR